MNLLLLLLHDHRSLLFHLLRLDSCFGLKFVQFALRKLLPQGSVLELHLGLDHALSQRCLADVHLLVANKLFLQVLVLHAVHLVNGRLRVALRAHDLRLVLRPEHVCSALVASEGLVGHYVAYPLSPGVAL